MAIDLQHHVEPVMPLGYSDLPRLMSRLTGDEKHSPAATSTLDVLWVLYDQILNVTPATADSPTLTVSCSARDTGRWPTTRC